MLNPHRNEMMRWANSCHLWNIDSALLSSVRRRTNGNCIGTRGLLRRLRLAEEAVGLKGIASIF
jgi:hypothetical protein